MPLPRRPAATARPLPDLDPQSRRPIRHQDPHPRRRRTAPPLLRRPPPATPADHRTRSHIHRARQPPDPAGRSARLTREQRPATPPKPQVTRVLSLARQPAHYTRSAFTMPGGELLLAKTAAPLRFVWTWPDADVATLDPTMVVVSREPDDRWYVTFAVDTDAPAPMEKTGHTIGMDLGV